MTREVERTTLFVAPVMLYDPNARPPVTIFRTPDGVALDAADDESFWLTEMQRKAVARSVLGPGLRGTP